jgi:hypothetical protein
MRDMTFLNHRGRTPGDEDGQHSAERLLTESRQLLHAVPDAIGVPLVLEMLACNVAIAGGAERVLVLASAAAEMREKLGNQVPPGLADQLATAVAWARAILDSETAARAWACGRTLPQDQAVAYVHASQ